MSIAAALAEPLHHSSGAPKYDKRVVEDAQHGAVRGQTTVDVPSLNVPALQMVEEVDADVLALLAFQEQAIVQELPAVPFSSSVTRAPQPTDVVHVLNVPALHFHDDDLGLGKFLEQVSIKEICEVQVLLSGASVVQEQVIVQSLPEVPVHVPQRQVPQRTVAQVVDAHVPRSSVSGSIVEQVVDVSVSCGLPFRHARVQQSTGPPGAVDPAEEQLDGFFSHFSREKVRRSLWSRLRSWCGT